jgi:transcription initiation factor TFIID subunit 10
MSAEASTSQQASTTNANQGNAALPNAQAGSSTANGNTNVNGTASQVTAVEPRENKETQEETEEELARLFTAKREEDMARRDRTLAEFLVMLDGYKPLVGPIDCCHGSWLINRFQRK